MALESTNTSRPAEFAAIDLGSNSFHLVVARVVNGAMQVLGRLKQRVYLAEGLDKNHYLSEEAIERALSCLALFAERLQGFSPLQVMIVGTHALREATNAQIFLDRAAAVIPYPIEIISGYEEARLIFMGVEHTQAERGRKLVIDIGGGSTELVIGENFEPLLIESRRMGCISFSHLFFPRGEINAANFCRARLAAAQKLETIAWQYRIMGWQVALGASGTFKAACEVLTEMRAKDAIITPQRLKILCDQVLQFTHFSALSLPGLSEERRAIFIPGLAILCGIMDALEIKELKLSDCALREGVLYEMEGRFRHQDIRMRTAKSLAEHYNVDIDQARRVWETTACLYQQWRAQNTTLENQQITALLKWAAQLHEVGLGINHSGMQRHSAYILQQTNMPGFNQEHQLLLATLVRHHRKAIKIDDFPRFHFCRRKHVLPCLQLLRLGVLLNNQRQATSPVRVSLTTQDYNWILLFPAGFFAQNNLVQLDLERERDYWSDVPGWSLRFGEMEARDHLLTSA
ncbi:exopolyphosphatase [secondary endosymbiont of Ctenarytaina eucalypti]|uniref:Exopolyphosphatase n=1 Tax=secondary endosymbiont of Ctenarytaina eucalypti TaxID=1199245 RepID=J3TFS7_9ENTR|nr:exopolyphosphatase [secondary endosymbiont of Ctenarytaina eucalypti]AFP85152.1 exopolyphosphatase [secondary endosymbiont of Ctenarytaina eucalypti]